MRFFKKRLIPLTNDCVLVVVGHLVKDPKVEGTPG